jgi:hypothetical protein
MYELDIRYETALERKLKILEIIRSLDLPNNPLDDIIDQVATTSWPLLFLSNTHIDTYIHTHACMYIYVFRRPMQ